jgi:hypothetical protein
MALTIRSGDAPHILLTSVVLFIAYCIWSSIPSTRSTPVRTIDTFWPNADDFMLRQLRFVVFDSYHPHDSDTNLFAYNNQTLGGSTTMSPLMISGTASAQLHRHRDSATMRLHHRDNSVGVSTSFCVLPHDMQDYDFKARFESLPNSTTRLDTQGYWRGHDQSGHHFSHTRYRPRNKPTRRIYINPQGPTHRVGEEGKKPRKP